MRARLFHSIAVSALLLACAWPATAQSVGASSRPVADASGALGWFNVRKPRGEETFDTWANRILDASAGGGWYWTENLKTHVDFGVTTKVERYSYERLVIDGRQTYSVSETTFSSRH